MICLLGVTCRWLLALLTLTSALAGAAELDEIQQLLVAQDVAVGDCERALERASELASNDARGRLLAGQCALRLARYPEAAELLAQAHSADPSLSGVNLYLGMTRYHLEDYPAARESFAAARVTGRETALLDFYSGLLQLHDDETRQAALSFERASATGPELVDPAASYYAALSWQALKESGAMDVALARVIASDPNGPWAKQARVMISREEQRRDPRSKRWVSITAGFEYDSNVVLRGAGIALPGDISDEEDIRGVWSGTAGAELFEKGKWSGGLSAAYAGNAHQDLKEFNQHYPTVSGWVDYQHSTKTHSRVRADFGYGWIDKNPFLLTTGLTGSVEHAWQDAGTTRCDAAVFYNDFKFDTRVGSFPPSPIAEGYLDRDGVQLRFGCEQDRGFWNGRILLIGSYHFLNYWADGGEWDHYSNLFTLGFRAQLPWRVRLDARGLYDRRDFRNLSFYAIPAFSPPTRVDNAAGFRGELSRPLSRWMVLSARYEYVDTNSNIEVFNYQRHVAGVYATLTFD
jgi:tetratricopeptide (TPR) repeat protein